MEICGRTYQVKKNDLIIVNPGDAHRTYADRGGECIVHFFAFKIARWKAFVRSIAGSKRFENRFGMANNEILSLYGKIQEEIVSRRPAFDIAVGSYITLLLLAVTRRRAAATTTADFTSFDARMNVSDMAKQSYLSRAYFSKKFKRETGESPARHILRKKMEIAKKLLTASDRKVRDIAFDVGFEDEYYFSKAFKRLERMTPTEFRRASSVG